MHYSKDFRSKRKKSTKGNIEMVAEVMAQYDTGIVPLHRESAEPIDSLLDSIIQGDNLATLKLIPDDKINLIITSPPYFKQRD